MILGLVLSIALLHHSPAFIAASTYNVVDYGAVSDVKIDSSKPLFDAWSDACRSSQASTIYVPRGTYLINGMINFEGPCNNNDTTFLIKGTLVAQSGYDEDRKYWLLFQKINGLTILGGILIARGEDLWACKTSRNGDCPVGATTLGIMNCKNVAIIKLKSVSSQLFHVTVNGCEDVYMRGLKIRADGDSPNTDGIHVQRSKRAAIINCKISTGDDCISIGPGTSELFIRGVSCGPGHGISIGSLGREFDEEGVHNVTVVRVKFNATQNGFRIKTWGKPSNCFVTKVVFKGAYMINVNNPIVIDQNYCPNDINCPNQASGVKISDITYQDIQGTSATKVAVKFDCSDDFSCKQITLKNIDLKYENAPAQTSCYNAAGFAFGKVEPTSCLSG